MSEISKMNPEIREQWIKDLRSGEYTKVRGELIRLNGDQVIGHCALGVLCEQAVKAGVIVRNNVRFGVNPATGVKPIEGDWSTATLPEAVKVWAGLETEGVFVESKRDEEGDTYEIPGLNDDIEWDAGNTVDRYTFDDIAGFIEADAKLTEEVAV